MLAQVNVTTYHNDNARTGQNTHETTLTTANVNTSAFGKLFSVSLDGQLYAQPLILSNANIGGGTHNVVYVATESDSVYAIDANNGTVYWKRTLLYNGGVPISDGDFGFNNNISPHYGSTGTPVIDASTNTLYVVASSKEYGSVAVHRLHALDTSSGADKLGANWIVVGGSYGGVTFNPAMQFNRPALLLNGTHVIVAFGQHSNSSAYGWLFSYNKSNLALEAVYNTNPGTVAGSIWMSGNGVAADSSGNMYFATGDGPWNGSTWFGDSILKMGLPASGNIPRLDYFTPRNQANLEEDVDLGSGGVLLLPDLPPGSAHPHLLVQAGKDGVIHLVNRDNMGQYCGSCSLGSTGDTNIVQEIHALIGLWGSPAYWNGNVYFSSGNDAGARDTLKAFSLNAGNSGVLSNTPTSQTPEAFGFSQPTPSVSSNGTSNGILWAIDSSSYASACCAILHAYNASNLASELYLSNSIPWRDGLGGAVKFSVPMVANGKVYVGGNGQLAVFGLLPASLSPANLNMGSRLQSDPPVSRNLTFSNTGSSTITITGMGVDTPFSVTGTTCGSTLAPGGNCSITVTFSPADASIGVNTSVLTISDSAVNSPQPAQVTGTMRCPSYGCL
jgi:hypothetical protein